MQRTLNFSALQVSEAFNNSRIKPEKTTTSSSRASFALPLFSPVDIEKLKFDDLLKKFKVFFEAKQGGVLLSFRYQEEYGHLNRYIFKPRRTFTLNPTLHLAHIVALRLSKAGLVEGVYIKNSYGLEAKKYKNGQGFEYFDTEYLRHFARSFTFLSI